MRAACFVCFVCGLLLLRLLACLLGSIQISHTVFFFTTQCVACLRLASIAAVPPPPLLLLLPVTQANSHSFIMPPMILLEPGNRSLGETVEAVFGMYVRVFLLVCPRRVFVFCRRGTYVLLLVLLAALHQQQQQQQQPTKLKTRSILLHCAYFK
jgi:hypothetical protein